MELKETLIGITDSLRFFQPELSLSIGILILVLIDLVLKKNKALILAVSTAFVVLISFWFVIGQWHNELPDQELFNGLLNLDKASRMWKLIFAGSTFPILVMAYKDEELRKKGEFYSIFLSVILGAFLLTMTRNLLMVYMSIELISIGSYILIGLANDKRSTEAALKYLLFGAVASGCMLYGISIIYGLTLSFNFAEPAFFELLMEAHQLPMVIAFILVLSGIFFKIALVPFHIWTPDVYTSGPTPVVTFLSIVPKLAGVAILVKWILVINLFGLGPVNWQSILAVIAMVTLLIGNFSALWQKNAKRMLAYSSIAHSGFLLIGVVAFSPTGYYGVFFYAVIFAIMNISAFGLLHHFEIRYGLKEINEFKGLVNVSPVMTVSMLVVMIALTGLPPTAGFSAKLFIFSSIWEAYSYSQNTWLIYLLVFGLFNSVISLFYYLKLPYFMIFKSTENNVEAMKKKLQPENYLTVILVLALLILFFKPDWLMEIINSISFAF